MCVCVCVCPANGSQVGNDDVCFVGNHQFVLISCVCDCVYACLSGLKTVEPSSQLSNCPAHFNPSDGFQPVQAVNQSPMHSL